MVGSLLGGQQQPTRKCPHFGQEVVGHERVEQAASTQGRAGSDTAGSSVVTRDTAAMVTSRMNALVLTNSSGDVCTFMKVLQTNMFVQGSAHVLHSVCMINTYYSIA